MCKTLENLEKEAVTAYDNAEKFLTERGYKPIYIKKEKYPLLLFVDDKNNFIYTILVVYDAYDKVMRYDFGYLDRDVPSSGIKDGYVHSCKCDAFDTEFQESLNILFESVTDEKEKNTHTIYPECQYLHFGVSFLNPQGAIREFMQNEEYHFWDKQEKPIYFYLG